MRNLSPIRALESIQELRRAWSSRLESGRCRCELFYLGPCTLLRFLPDSTLFEERYLRNFADCIRFLLRTAGTMCGSKLKQVFSTPPCGKTLEIGGSLDELVSQLIAVERSVQPESVERQDLSRRCRLRSSPQEFSRWQQLIGV